MSCDAIGVTGSVTGPKAAASASHPNQDSHTPTILQRLPSIAAVQPEQMPSMAENTENREDRAQFDDFAKVLEHEVNFEYEASPTSQPCVKGS